LKFDIYISSKIASTIQEVLEIATKEQVNIEIKDFVKNRALDQLEETLPAYVDALKDFKGKLAMHGAFQGLNPISAKLKKQEQTINRFDQTIMIAKKLNVKTIVFHSGFDAFDRRFYTDRDFIRSFIENQVQFWSEYIQKLDNTDIIAVLENTSERNPDILPEIVDRVGSKNLKLCIDTGHVNHKTDFTVSEWIKRTGKHLHYMHLHNNYKLFDEHNSLLRGSINFTEVFQTLVEQNLQPGLSLEIHRYSPSMESLDFIKQELKKLGAY